MVKGGGYGAKSNSRCACDRPDRRDLFRYAASHRRQPVQSLSEAEDIVQSVYVRLMTARPRFRNGEHERAWLIRTAVNLCKDYHKSAARRSFVPLDEETAAAFPRKRSRCSTPCTACRKRTVTRCIFITTSKCRQSRSRAFWASARVRSRRGFTARGKN